jgi:hypothetical protein
MREAHTDWCAGGHLCNLGEHRAAPVSVHVHGVGRFVLTRIRGQDGRQYVEVRVAVALPRHEGYARLQLVRLMHGLTRALAGHR